MNSVGGSLGPMQQTGMQQGSVQSAMIHGNSMNQINVIMGNQVNLNVSQSPGNVITGSGPMINVNSMGNQGVNPSSMPTTINITGPIPNSMSGPMPGQVPSQIGSGMMHSQMNVHLQGPQRKVQFTLLRIRNSRRVYAKKQNIIPVTKFQKQISRNFISGKN